MRKLNYISRFSFATFILSCFLLAGQVSAGVLDKYVTVNSTNIYGQFNSAVRKFSRGEFSTAEKQIATALEQYQTQKIDDKAWLARTNFLMARVKVSLKRDAFKDKDDIRKFYTESYNIYSTLESGEENTKDNLAEVTFYLTSYLLTLPVAQRNQKDAEFIANLPDHMKLKMSDDWNVKLGLIQAKLDEEAEKPVDARKTLLTFVERMPAHTAERAHVYGRIGQFFDSEKNLEDASDYYTRAHNIYTYLGDSAHAGRIAYALQKVELYRGAYVNTIKFADEAVAWIEANEKRALAAKASKAKADDEAPAVAGAAVAASTDNSAATWPPQSANNDEVPAPAVVVVKKEEAAEQYEVQNKIVPFLNKGEAQLVLSSDSTGFNDARQTFEHVGTLIDDQLKAFRQTQGGLDVSSIGSAPLVGKNAKEKRLLLKLRVYKVVSLVGEARAQLPSNPSSARSRMAHAIKEYLPHVDKNFSRLDALKASVHSTFWQVAMREHVGSDEAALKALATELPGSKHALPKESDSLAKAVAEEGYDIFDARAMWKAHYVRAKLSLLAGETSKTLEHAEKALKLATDKGFLHYGAKSHDLIALAKTHQAEAKTAKREEAKADDSDDNKQDRAKRLSDMKLAIGELEKAAAEANEKATELRKTCGLLSSWTGGALGYTVLDEAGVV